MNILLAPFAWLLTAFYNLFNNYGLAIILFAVIIKVILFPFALKGKRSMVKMTALQGRAQRIQAQYANNKTKQQEELQALYDRENVNPMSGCLWTTVPFLLLLPLYAIIRQPIQYMMGVAAEQVTAIAGALGFELTGAYGELVLASLVGQSAGNLSAAQAVNPNVFAINFDFLGMNLAQTPQWQIWTQPFTWNNVGLFLMPIVSAVFSVCFSIVMNKTNHMNNPDGAQNNNVFMTYIFSPLMSLWIGYWMPAGLCLYWIANSVLSLVQELIAARLLKKDYAAAAETRRKQELLEKEEEKRRKAALAAERAKRAEEKKKGKKKEKKEHVDPGVDVTASRVGIRAYARGRNYDPNRFGGVTPYKDPDQVVDEDAIEKAMEAKAEQAAEAAMEAEITAKVAAEVAALDADTAEEVEKRLNELHAEEAEAKADALAETLKKGEEALDEAWEEVTGEHSGDESTEEE